MNADAGHYLLTQRDSPQEADAELTPAKRHAKRRIKENLFAGNAGGILNFGDQVRVLPRWSSSRAKGGSIVSLYLALSRFRLAHPNTPRPVPAPRPHLAMMQPINPGNVPRQSSFETERKALREVAAAANKTPTRGLQHLRHVAQNPDRILDAPDLRCDFYLNVLDWSSKNVIAIALGETVYLWDATNGSIKELFSTSTLNDYVSSLNWTEDGDHLAVGTAMNEVQIWDVARGQLVRTVQNEFGRISAMSWNRDMLSAGTRNGAIFNHDVRAAASVVQTLRGGHHQEICGLKWSPDKRYLASGGNDNVVNVWNTAGNTVHQWRQHNAAVKAIAWCPWQSSLLATGGGTDDRTIKMWNVNLNSKNLVSSTETKSQISSLIWNKEYREIVSGHGFSDNHLSIWKYQNAELHKVTELKGHTERVLAMAMSPDASTVVSAGGDETLRFWKCFAGADKLKKSSADRTPSRLNTGIR